MTLVPPSKLAPVCANPKSQEPIPNPNGRAAQARSGEPVEAIAAIERAVTNQTTVPSGAVRAVTVEAMG